MTSRILKTAVLLVFIASGFCQSSEYYGIPIGNFKTFSNDIEGEVFIVNEDSLFIKGFSYDGNSEDAIFWAGFSDSPDNSGFIIPSDGISLEPLPEYSNHDILLQLPEKKRAADIRWLSVWNRKSSKTLGSLIFPNSINIPHPIALGPLVNTKKGVSAGDVLILDTQTFLITDFTYDVSDKETYWWLSKGTKPSEVGIKLQENGSDAPLERSVNNTIAVIVPKEYSVLEYDTLSIWDLKNGEQYGFVDIPHNLNIPPSLHLLGKEELEMDEFNCEMLNDNLGLEIRWMIKENDIVFHLIGNIGPTEYMSLGFSKDDAETKFESADAVVAGIDSKGKGYVTDYFFQSTEKCNNGQGMCPDYIYGSSDHLNLLEAERKENTTIIMFKRQLKAAEKKYDQNIYTDGPQAILWAVGPLDSNGFAETPRLKSRGNLLLDFGREPTWNCPPPKQKLHSSQMKEKNHRIHCPSDRTFRAQIGSSPRSNVKKVWFINGLPTPQLTVQRGNTYIFIIEGGLNPPIHHPFYITTSNKGGMFQNILEATDPEEYSFGGVRQDPITGNIYPTAEGRLCMWTYSELDLEYSIVTSNQDVKSTLVLKCEPGKPGKLFWTPDASTPDIVYYQSFKERNLGGEIKVLDFCEETNPHRYLEITTKGGKSKQHEKRDGLELEREDEFAVYPNLKHEENLNIGETAEHNPGELSYIKESRENNKHIISNNVIKSLKSPSGATDETVNVSNISLEHYSVENVTDEPQYQVPESQYSETLFPHDESERADVYLPNHELPKQNALNKYLNTNTNPDDIPVKRPSHSLAASNIPAPITQNLHGFKPQFEGGFVPLVLNPIKEKEFSQTKELTYIHQQRSRPHRPFLYNESVPFHGTFKPGVPDFSGFNISHYSQEDASIIIDNNQDDLSVLLASKPQHVRESLPSIGTIPLHLLQRPHIPPQRTQEMFHRYRQPSPPFGLRQNVFPQIELNRKLNNPTSSLKDEDLVGVSSQRIHTSLQASGEKKTHPGSIRNQQLPVFDRKQRPQNPQLNKILHPPPIQRRPDLYETREVNFQQSNSQRLKFISQPLLNARQNLQKPNFPPLQTTVLQTNSNARPYMQSSSLIYNRNLPINRQPSALPSEQVRHPYPLPLRERVPNLFPLVPKLAPPRLLPSSKEEMKIGNGFLNRPQGQREILHLPTHSMDSTEKFQEKVHEIKSMESDLSPNENSPFSFLHNSEFEELIRKTQPYVNEKPIMHTDLMSQNVHLKEKSNIFINNNTGIENVHISTVIRSNIDKKDGSFGSTVSYPPVSHDVGNNENKSAINEAPKSKTPNLFTNPVATSTQDEVIHSVTEMPIKEDEIKLENMAPFNNQKHADQTEHREQENTPFEVSIPVLSASQPSKVDNLPVLIGYEHESLETGNNNSDAIDSEYVDHKVPFGFRLKSSDNSKATTKSSNENLRIPGVVFRKSHVPNKNGEIKVPSSITKAVELTTEANTEASHLESITILSSYEREENISKAETDSNKSLYYTPPFAADFITSQKNKTTIDLNFHSIPAYEVKHIPIIADNLEDFIETQYIGRKNILPDNSNPAFPNLVSPPKVSENLNLPQISESLNHSDNRTNYFILDHVLSLIGNPPDSKDTS